MIKKIILLQFSCDCCRAAAKYRVVRSNADLDPDRYYNEGERMEHYCERHMPEDAMQMWRKEKQL